MRAWLTIALLVAMIGCASSDPLRPGRTIDAVSRDLGPPDVVLEQAGDLGRYYTPASPPTVAWNTNALDYFYLRSNKKIRFIDGRLVQVSPLSEDDIAEVQWSLGVIATTRPK